MHDVPSPGRRSFLSNTQKGTKKVTAEGTELPWMALRRTRGKLACLRRAQTVPLLVPDAAPSQRPFSLGGFLVLRREYSSIQNIAALVQRALKNPQPKAVKGHLLFENRRPSLGGIAL